MTIRKTATRPIDNRRLYSLTTGEVYMPTLGKHVPWEAHGERAVLMMADRRTGLINVVSQPERMRLEVGGKKVTYTPDFELIFRNAPNEVWEVKGDQQLQEARVQEKLAAAELEVARTERRFLIFNSGELNTSTELRNVQLLRRYAGWPVTEQQIASILSAFREYQEIQLHVLVDAVSQYDMGREQIYALLYDGTLDHDWTKLIADKSLIYTGKSYENPSI